MAILKKSLYILPEKIIPNHSPLYIRLSKAKVSYTVEVVEDAMLIDYDANGWPIGIELLGGFSIEGAPKRIINAKKIKKSKKSGKA